MELVGRKRELAALPSGSGLRLLLVWVTLGLKPVLSCDLAGVQDVQVRQQSTTSVASDLLLAVRASDADRVRAALDAGADVNGRDALGGTALLEACWIGNSSIVGMLVSRGADVNVVHRESGATPLRYAVLTSRPAVVQQLLAAGADVHHLYRDGGTVLHVAAGRNNAAIVEMLIKAGADLEAANRDGNTPLDEAVLHDQRAVVDGLLANGAAVGRERPTDGRSAIHEASMRGFSDLIAPLVRAGASPLQADRFGQTPLDLALAYKNGNVVAELLKVGALEGSQAAAEQAMESAVLKGQTEIVQLLLRSGFAANRPTASGSTYLHDAALKNQVRVAQVLIAAGASLEAKNRSGGTPLHDAALGGSLDTINVLLDSGAAIDARDTESKATPLMLAASLDRVQAVELLLKRGADPKLMDASGKTAYDRAKVGDDPALVRVLQPGSGRVHAKAPSTQ